MVHFDKPNLQSGVCVVREPQGQVVLLPGAFVREDDTVLYRTDSIEHASDWANEEMSKQGHWWPGFARLWQTITDDEFDFAEDARQACDAAAETLRTCAYYEGHLFRVVVRTPSGKYSYRMGGWLPYVLTRWAVAEKAGIWPWRVVDRNTHGYEYKNIVE